MQSRGIATKADRLATITMLTEAISSAAGYTSQLVVPAKVCAGKQVDRTRLLLSVCGHLALGNEVNMRMGLC